MRIALIGNGNMGKLMQLIAKKQIVKVIENFKYCSLEDNLNIDVLIDFSHRDNLSYICSYALRNKCKVVIATTNLNNDDYNLLEELSESVPVMVDSNYSYGILILRKIINENIEYLNNYDIQILEKHHKYKKDSPSGTAKGIEMILDGKGKKYNTAFIRGGTIRGEHIVSFFGDDEYIEIKHVSQSRKIYALGALEAAKWLMCKEKGLFSYQDCIFEK